MLEPLGVGPICVGGGQGQLVEHLLGGTHGFRGERGDTPRELSDELVQFGVGQCAVDPAVPLGLVRIEIRRAKHCLHGPAPTEQPRQMLYTTRARWRTESDLRLAQHGILAGGESHVACQRQFAARAAGPPAQLCDRNHRHLLSLRHSMPNDASSGPPALAASAVYSATFVRSTCGTKYSGSALSSTTTRTSSDSISSSKPTRSRTSSGPIRFIGGASMTTVMMR